MNKQGIFSLGSIVLGLMLPLVTFGQIRINEIAWMGTTESANAEWIELFNESDSEVVLDGWKIVAYDGSPKINLVGSIGPGEYYLLERTNDNTIANVLADTIYSGSLGNSGEHLQLINNTGEIVEDLDFSSSWPAGDNATKFTMQLNDGVWITGEPTPGQINTVESDSVVEVTSNQSGTSTTSSSDSVTSSKKISGVEVTQIEPNHSYSAQVIIPDYVVAGVPFPLKVLVTQDKKRDMVSGRFEWYLGDGSAYRYYKNTEFEHRFHYPGEYTLVLEYYSNSMKEEIDSIHKKKIVVIPDSLILESIDETGGITIKNKSTRDIDLHRWSLYAGDNLFTFPKYTLVKKGGILTVPKSIHDLNKIPSTSIQLLNPDKVVVSRFEYGMLGP